MNGIILLEIIVFGLVMLIIGMLIGESKEAERNHNTLKLLNDKINELVRKYKYNPNVTDFNERD